MITALASCQENSPEPSLKFLSTPAALVHAGENTRVPVRTTDAGATITASGNLPAGMTFRPGQGGTAAIAGVPGGDAGGYYQVRLTAADGTVGRLRS